MSGEYIELELFQCSHCGDYFACSIKATYRCPSCGFYNGDHDLKRTIMVGV